MPGGHRLGALACAAALLVAAPAAFGQAARRAEVDAHYLVLEWDAKEGVRPKFHRLVKMARPPASLSEAELVAAEEAPRGRRARSVSYRVKGRDGKVAFRGRAVIPRQIRGEFHGHGPGEPIEGVHFETDRATFVVRVARRPEHETLVIEGAKRTSLDLRRMEAAALGAAPTRTRPPSIATSAATGDPSNRVDIVLLGDGYTAAEELKFFEDAARVEGRFFGVSPYAEYRNHVNFTALFTASQESGADHPPYDAGCALTDPSCCLDPTALGDSLAGRYVETAFGARYCSLGSHRLLVVDNTAEMFEAASQVPDWDELIVLVNDSTYGGSGGLFAVLSNEPSAVEVVQHEFGHSFSGLADEYDLANPASAPCSDLVRNACQANVTDETRRERIKWSAWIDPSTPVPTPAGLGYERDVGLFEGAFYLPIGMYRPREDCAMRSLGAEFCEVCRQNFVLNLYRGGWGVPARGIDPIEPGSESPPPGAVSSELCPLSFSADLLEPAGGPPLDVGWFVDGVEVATGGGAAFEFSPPGPGGFAVELRVRDVTPFVHPEMRGRALDSMRRWSVDVSEEPCPGSCSDGPDGDADGVDDECDVCPLVADAAQGDADGDGIGDACECGDANGDGRVDADDARLVQRCAAGAISCSALCDVTGEGVCNTIDARVIQRLASGRLGKADLHCAERP